MKSVLTPNSLNPKYKTLYPKTITVLTFMLFFILVAWFTGLNIKISAINPRNIYLISQLIPEHVTLPKSKQFLDKVANINKNVQKSKKKSKFSHLTKKQRKKLRMRKANRVIQSFTKAFVRFGPIRRNAEIFQNEESYKVIHDGYSWVKIMIIPNMSFYRAGSIAFKTRPLSIVKFSDKGTPNIKMKQVSTYKIKNTKIKRKK